MACHSVWSCDLAQALALVYFRPGAGPMMPIFWTWLQVMTTPLCSAIYPLRLLPGLAEHPGSSNLSSSDRQEAQKTGWGHRQCKDPSQNKWQRGMGCRVQTRPERGRIKWQQDTSEQQESRVQTRRERDHIKRQQETRSLLLPSQTINYVPGLQSVVSLFISLLLACYTLFYLPGVQSTTPVQGTLAVY